MRASILGRELEIKVSLDCPTCFEKLHIEVESGDSKQLTLDLIKGRSFTYVDIGGDMHVAEFSSFEDNEIVAKLDWPTTNVKHSAHVTSEIHVSVVDVVRAKILETMQ